MVSKNNRRNRRLRALAQGMPRPRIQNRAVQGPLMRNGAFAIQEEKVFVPTFSAPSGASKRKRRNRIRRNRGMIGNPGQQNTGRLGLSMGASRSGPRNRARIVEDDEYIADINGSTAFALTSFPVNPGQAVTFPRLAREAVLYEKYAVEFLEFYYKREVSEFATNGQAGKLMLSADYNASDAPPTSKQQVMDSDPHVDGMPCSPVLVLRIDPRTCNDSEGKLHYVRPGGLPGAADIKTYDVANLFVSTIGCTNTTLIGELHVRYRFRLEVPVLEPSNSFPANNSVSWFQSTTTEPAGATNTPTTMLLATASTNGLSAVNTAGSIVLPPGNYLMEARSIAANNNAAGVLNITDLQKNGVTVLTSAAGRPINETSNAVYAQDASTSLEAFVTSNGTDVFTVVVTDVYNAGATTNYGSLLITAI